MMPAVAGRDGVREASYNSPLDGSKEVESMKPAMVILGRFHNDKAATIVGKKTEGE
jgi:hypothetical protein